MTRAKDGLTYPERLQRRRDRMLHGADLIQRKFSRKKMLIRLIQIENRIRQAEKQKGIQITTH